LSASCPVLSLPFLHPVILLSRRSYGLTSRPDILQSGTSAKDPIVTFLLCLLFINCRLFYQCCRNFIFITDSFLTVWSSL
jgi:hypothetical protein